jgi:hypothetical protein
VGDNTAPALSITAPRDGETFTLVNGQVAVEVRGTASDTQSGVLRVEWMLDGQSTFTQATPKAAGDWSTWSAQVAITVGGNRSVTVRATDGFTPANSSTAQRNFAVAEPFHPQDTEAVFSPTAYLDDLLTFSTQRARTAAGGPLITRQLLVNTFLRPFVDLVVRANRAVANQSANQVRLCISTLRRYLAKNSLPCRLRPRPTIGWLRTVRCSDSLAPPTTRSGWPGWPTTGSGRCGVPCSRLVPSRSPTPAWPTGWPDQKPNECGARATAEPVRGERALREDRRGGCRDC